MQARPRFISTLLAILAGTVVVGCGESSSNEDPLAAVADQYRELLQNRQIIRENAAAGDDTPEQLRTLAGRAQAAGRDGDEHASAILTAGIRSSAASLDFDEALRIESRASAMRDRIRGLAAAADLLAASADSAEGLDVADTSILLEGRLAESREAFNAADSELEGLRNQTEAAEAQRDENLAKAMQAEEIAAEETSKASEMSAMDAQDSLNTAAYFREQAHLSRIAAALDEISIQTMEPTMSLANARRTGQGQIMDAARDALRAAEDRIDESRSFASDVRRRLDDMAGITADTLAEIEEIHRNEVMPRLEASIADFESAVTSARGLTRGGSREDATSGWRTIANAQFGIGRTHWEIATIQGRQADLLARLAQGGILADASSAARASNAAADARKQSLEAAETSFNEAISSLSNIQGQDAASNAIRKAIERAIDGVTGAAMIPPPMTASSGGSMGGGGSSGFTRDSGASSGGFGTPAELANFLSDSTNLMMPSSMARLEGILKAETPAGDSVRRIITSAGIAVPLVSAIADTFGPDAVMEIVNGSSDAFSIGPAAGSLSSFSVDAVDGNTATLKSSDGSQTLRLVKSPGGWIIDLDQTVESDPRMKMAAQMMLPLLEQQLAPVRAEIEQLTARVRAGEFESIEELKAEMAD